MAMRVRFAPSPTGALHIGGARTALYNWLLARHAGGTLVLRIEDTDRERSTPENVEQILDALRWLELDWDEGPILQQPNATATRRRCSGCSTRPRLPLERDRRRRQGLQGEHGADRGFRGEAEDEGAVRLRVPDEGETVVARRDPRRTRFQHVHLDDPVIARADGSVLYNFAVAIDDLDAGITHVVRGEDHLSNTPKQLLVSRRWAPSRRCYAHLPLLHGPDGKKLSKRHGAASVQELRDAGYLPEAVRNYLALLGWGDADDETIVSTDELVERFRLERVSRNPARFDEQKLRWMNGRYIRELGVERADRRAWRRFTGRDAACAPAVAISRGEDPDAGRLLAAGRVHLRRPGRRSQGAREVARRGRPRGARRPRATRSPASSRSRSRAIEPALRERGRAAAARSRARSSSRCAWRSPGRPCRRGSSRASRCSAATRRCGASTRRSQR